jgi:very-short-patch-repair endonuclease
MSLRTLEAARGTPASPCTASGSCTGPTAPRRDGFPVTSVARTLLDLAATETTDRLARVIEQAERLQLLELRALNALLARSRGRRGCGRLRGALADYLPEAKDTRTELERSFLQLCRDAGLATPKVNVIVEGFEVDMAWPDERLVVELDSFEFHRTRAAFERDRVRDTALKLAGWDSVRVTYRRLEREPSAVVENLRALLSPLRGEVAKARREPD